MWLFPKTRIEPASRSRRKISANYRLRLDSPNTRIRASDPSKWIAEAINNLSGGSKYSSGVFSPTADQTNYLVGQLTGRGRAGARQSGTVDQGNRYRGRFAAAQDSAAGRPLRKLGGAVQPGHAFYANIKRINEVEAEIKGRRKDRLPIDDITRLRIPITG